MQSQFEKIVFCNCKIGDQNAGHGDRIAKAWRQFCGAWEIFRASRRFGSFFYLNPRMRVNGQIVIVDF